MYSLDDSKNGRIFDDNHIHPQDSTGLTCHAPIFVSNISWEERQAWICACDQNLLVQILLIGAVHISESPHKVCHISEHPPP